LLDSWPFSLLQVSLSADPLDSADCEYKVTLHVYSGTPDPTWTISGPEAWQFRLRLPYSRLHTGARDRYPVLGYQGVSVIGNGDDSYEVVGAMDLERWLLTTAPAGLLPPQVISYVHSILDRIENDTSVDVAVADFETDAYVTMS
jgi:hypothetical protein